MVGVKRGESESRSTFASTPSRDEPLNFFSKKTIQGINRTRENSLLVEQVITAIAIIITIAIAILDSIRIVVHYPYHPYRHHYICNDNNSSSSSYPSNQLLWIRKLLQPTRSLEPIL